MKNFTFKTEKPTGRYRSFDSNTNYIKLNKIEIGTISDEAPFIIRLRIIKTDIMENGNKNCPWKWIRLKKESASLKEAKEFLKNNVTGIITKYKFPED
jgi:hypothetical protein